MLTKVENCILVPIDLTEQTVIAFGQSHNLARLTNSKIVLLSVDEGNPPSSVRKALDEIANVEIITRKGNVYEEINKVADEINPLFVMIGLTSKITLDKITGQNAYRMIRESKHPVITIRGKVHRDGCKIILLPLDLTKETREKVHNAVELAKLFNAEIRIISILTDEGKSDENKLISYSNQVWKYIKDHGVGCTVKTLRGKDVVKMVLDYGNEIEADLILIMSKAELSMTEFFIGSVAQRLINESDIPVLSYRPMKRKDTAVFSK
jgi:nucleotide-binding universal stress UspA family protein